MPTISFTTSGTNASRVAAAFGKQLNLQTTDDPPVPRDATGAEVKQQVVQFIKGIVNAQEGTALRAAVVVPELTVT